MTPQEINENSTEDFTLQSQENIFIYYEYEYSEMGTYNITATVNGEIFSDSENITITIS